jgi:hypothetical protein
LLHKFGSKCLGDIVIKGRYDLTKFLLRDVSDWEIRYKGGSEKIKDLRRDVMDKGRFELSGM